MSKRQRFVISSALSTCLLIGATVASVEWRYRMVGLLAIVPGLLAIWSLWEGWKGVARFMTLILPVMFAVGAGWFTFLLPPTVAELWIWSWNIQVGEIIGWGLRGGFWLLFAVAFYALLLTENIFSVSAVRTIALARAAGAVGFLLTLVTGFFLYNAIWSFRWPYYWNGPAIAGVTFWLLVQGLWAAKLEDKLERHIWVAALMMGLVVGQVAGVLSFWPVSIAVASLVVTTLLYVLLGLYQQELLRRLFRKTLWEYLTVGMVVLGIVVVTTKWGG